MKQKIFFLIILTAILNSCTESAKVYNDKIVLSFDSILSFQDRLNFLVKTQDTIHLKMEIEKFNYNILKTEKGIKEIGYYKDQPSLYEASLDVIAANKKLCEAYGMLLDTLTSKNMQQDSIQRNFNTYLTEELLKMDRIINESLLKFDSVQKEFAIKFGLKLIEEKP